MVDVYWKVGLRTCVRIAKMSYIQIPMIQSNKSYKDLNVGKEFVALRYMCGIR